MGRDDDLLLFRSRLGIPDDDGLMDSINDCLSDLQNMRNGRESMMCIG
jgi:hypothetical protein